jgi:hypothetical protein
MLLRVRSITSTHHDARPQLDESHEAFVAVERWIAGSGWCRIRRRGLERILQGNMFPCDVAELEVKGLKHEEFSCHVFRDRDVAKDAGGRGDG